MQTFENRFQKRKSQKHAFVKKVMCVVFLYKVTLPTTGLAA